MTKDIIRSMTPTSTSDSPVFAKRKSCGDLPKTERLLVVRFENMVHFETKCGWRFVKRNVDLQQLFAGKCIFKKIVCQIFSVDSFWANIFTMVICSDLVPKFKMQYFL